MKLLTGSNHCHDSAKPHDFVRMTLWRSGLTCDGVCSPHQPIIRETAMSESDDISGRLTALETVVSQLITHLAVRSDDPAGWVETRKVLALNAINAREAPGLARTARLQEAICGFFDQ